MIILLYILGSVLAEYETTEDDMPFIDLRPKPKARGGAADKEGVNIYSVIFT